MCALGEMCCAVLILPFCVSVLFLLFMCVKVSRLIVIYVLCFEGYILLIEIMSNFRELPFSNLLCVTGTKQKVYRSGVESVR